MGKIPLSALMPENSKRVFCAGRCISSDTLANSGVRVEAVAMATGQASGCAAAVLANKGEVILPKNTRCVVLPFDLKLTLTEDVRKLTYCLDGTSGDVSALNIQKRETCTCFEVLYGVFMSRVFIPFDSKYTVKQVLLCVCIMCGWGASIDKLIPLVNELLK